MTRQEIAKWIETMGEEQQRRIVSEISFAVECADCRDDWNDAVTTLICDALGIDEGDDK